MSQPESRNAEEPRGPLLFWRDTDSGKQGLACLIDFCANPECTCQEGLIQAVEVDERFAHIVSRPGTIETRWREGGDKPHPTGRVTAQVNLATGEVSPDKGKRRSPAPVAEAALLDWLREAMDTAVLEDLRRRWVLFKEARKAEEEALERSAWKDRDWTNWDGEKRIAWEQVAPGATQGIFQLDGRSYEARDHYCIAPDCDCEEVSVYFFAREDGAIGEMVGEVILEAPSGEVIETNNPPGLHGTLQRLWAAYEERKDLGALSRRWHQMKRIGPDIQALREKQLRPATTLRERVGRNAPCPCGSGKKYKKCCGS